MSAKKFNRLVLFVVALAMTLPTARTVQAQGIDAETVRQLQEIIQQQQEQLQQQQAVLQSLQQQVQALQEDTGEMEAAKSEAMAAAAQAKQAQEQARQAEAQARQAEEKALAYSVDAQTAAGTSPTGKEAGKMVTSANERVSLVISGQVNRMVSVGDDGESTKLYHVDNDNSSSRFRFVALGKVTEEFSLGATVELEVESNASGDVSQDNQEASTNINDRIVEVAAEYKPLGKLTIGQGSTASDGTSEVDLSGTGVINYSSISDHAGGLKFRDSSGNLLDLQIKEVFSNFDGLSRRDRLRYDSPKLAGFQISGSAISDDRWDAAVRWAGQGYGFKVAAAAAVSDPQTTGDNNRYSSSASALHDNTGLNITLAAAVQDRESGRSNSEMFYVKGGWIANFFKFGDTAFSVDYYHGDDIGQNGDNSDAVGAAVVQNVKEFGTEIYGTVRNYDLDRRGQSTDDITVGSAGARIKF